MPQCVEKTGFSFGYSLPQMAIRPPGSGDSTPEMILISVDLPEPFSPTRQCTSPTSSVRSTSRSACTPPKRFDMPDISRKVVKGSSCNGTVCKASSRRGSLSRPERSGMRLEKSAGAGVVLEPSSNQPIDGFLVDAHDLVDLDLLSGDIDRCFAKAWNVDAIRDRLAIEHELGDRNHGITCISGVPQKAFAYCVLRDQTFRLARQYGADHGDLLAKALLTHRVAGPDRSVRAEAENTTQVRIGLDHVKRRALAGVDLVGAGETVGDELHFGKVLLLIGNRGVSPLVVKRRRQGPDIDHIIAFTTHVLGETLHLHLTEANGIDQFHIPVTAFLFGALMRDDLDSCGLGALEHRFAHLHVQWHQANYADLPGNQILEQFYLLRGIDVRRPNHRGIDAEILGALLNPLFKRIEPRNARDLHDRDHFLLGLRKGKARKTGTGQRGGTTHQLECLASVHCSLPGNDFSCRSLDRHTPGGSSQLHF